MTDDIGVKITQLLEDLAAAVENEAQVDPVEKKAADDAILCA
jgi:hypothetical protein